MQTEYKNSNAFVLVQRLSDLGEHEEKKQLIGW